MEIETDYEPVEIVPTTRQLGKYKLAKCMDCGEYFTHLNNPRNRPKRCPECKRILAVKRSQDYRARIKQKAEVKRLVDISERKRKEREELVRRELESKIASRRSRAEERRQMLARLRRRDAASPAPKIEVIERGRVRIERRGVVPAGGRAVAVVPHN